LTKVVIYFCTENSPRKAGASGAEFKTASHWEELKRSLQEEDQAMVILDSVPPRKRPELTRRIKKIKDVPVIYFEQSISPKRRGGIAGGSATRAQRSGAKKSKIDPMESARRYMDSNFQSPLTLARISSRAGTSPSYFCRKFKTRYGVTPITYLRNLRLARACYLLEHTDLPLSDIIAQSGFFSIPYFCKEFRKLKGTSPIRFRELCRKQNNED